MPRKEQKLWRKKNKGEEVREDYSISRVKADKSPIVKKPELTKNDKMIKSVKCNFKS